MVQLTRGCRLQLEFLRGAAVWEALPDAARGRRHPRDIQRVPAKRFVISDVQPLRTGYTKELLTAMIH